jgi:hypothetical protein
LNDQRGDHQKSLQPSDVQSVICVVIKPVFLPRCY